MCIRDRCRQVGSHPGLPVSFFMQMDSRDTQKRYGRVWIDLASHPLSVLMEFCGPGRILPGSAQVAVGEQQTVDVYKRQQPVHEAPMRDSYHSAQWACQVGNRHGTGDALAVCHQQVVSRIARHRSQSVKSARVSTCLLYTSRCV